MDFQLTEGKFEGRNLDQLVCTYPGYKYLEYLHQLQPGLMIDQGTWDKIDLVMRTHPMIPECTVENARAFVLRFGKHKGRSLEMLASSIQGQGYLRFLSSKQDMFPDVRHHVKILLQNTPTLYPVLNTALGTVISFGKYTGRAIGDVAGSYRGRIYIEWVVSKRSPKTPYVVMKSLEVVMNEMIKPQGSSMEPTPEDRAYRLRFGIFRGKTYPDLILLDAGRSWMRQLAQSRYATWVQQQEIQWYLNNFDRGMV